jgi:hypothetical protein
LRPAVRSLALVALAQADRRWWWWKRHHSGMLQHKWSGRGCRHRPPAAAAAAFDAEASHVLRDAGARQWAWAVLLVVGRILVVVEERRMRRHCVLRRGGLCAAASRGAATACHRRERWRGYGRRHHGVRVHRAGGRCCTARTPTSRVVAGGGWLLLLLLLLLMVALVADAAHAASVAEAAAAVPAQLLLLLVRVQAAVRALCTVGCSAGAAPKAQACASNRHLSHAGAGSPPTVCRHLACSR